MRQVMALLVVLSVITVPAVAAEEPVDAPIDSNHSLVTEEKKTAYQKNGSATTTPTEWPSVTITVAKEHEAVNLSGAHSDIQNDYVRIRSDAGNVTYRIYIPSEYFTPREHLDMEAANNPSITADVVPVNDYQMTAITVTFETPGVAVFKMSEEAGIVFGHIHEYKQRVNNTTGIKLPDFLGGANWHYVTPSDFNENTSTHAIKKPKSESVMIQYDIAEGNESQTYLPVPQCSESESTDVCKFTKQNDDKHIYLMLKTDNPPPVRYAYGTDTIEQVKASLRDLSRIDERIQDVLDKIASMFGGG